MKTEDIENAKKARLNSYSPYTNYKTGAILRCKNGKTYTGCNIENVGVQSICSERTAFVKALSEGEREFESITVVGAPKGVEPTEECLPCGYCRQFIKEFVDENFKIYTQNGDKIKEYTIQELLPHSFNFEV